MRRDWKGKRCKEERQRGYINESMANAAAKKQAVSNVQALKTLHAISAVVNSLFIVSYFVLHRPNSIKPYIFLSLPAFFLEYQLERIGRPRYDTKGSLISSGDDLSQEGLTEWFHDIIYVTWGCVVVVILTGSNKAWYFYSSIPGYVVYKVYTMFFSGNGGARSKGESEEETKSKRQEKLEKRGQRVKYN